MYKLQEKTTTFVKNVNGSLLPQWTVFGRRGNLGRHVPTRAATACGTGRASVMGRITRAQSVPARQMTRKRVTHSLVQVRGNYYSYVLLFISVCDKN